MIIAVMLLMNLIIALMTSAYDAATHQSEEEFATRQFEALVDEGFTVRGRAVAGRPARHSQATARRTPTPCARASAATGRCCCGRSTGASGSTTACSTPTSGSTMRFVRVRRSPPRRRVAPPRRCRSDGPLACATGRRRARPHHDDDGLWQHALLSLLPPSQGRRAHGQRARRARGEGRGSRSHDWAIAPRRSTTWATTLRSRAKSNCATYGRTSPPPLPLPSHLAALQLQKSSST